METMTEIYDEQQNSMNEGRYVQRENVSEIGR